MSSGSKKGTFLFSQKSPANEPPQVPQKGPYGERYPFIWHLQISQKPHKILPNKKALRKKRPSMFPKNGAPVEAGTHIRALLSISFRVPRKRSPP